MRDREGGLKKMENRAWSFGLKPGREVEDFRLCCQSIASDRALSSVK